MNLRILLGLCFYCFCFAAVANDERVALNNAATELLNNAEAGALVLNDGEQVLPGLLLSTDVDVEITGPVASVTYVQRFYNHADSFVEGQYAFPLPENAAVHAMEVRVGERHIVGEIKEKAIAKKIYEKAKSEGKRTALVQQRRPKLFSTSVANIAPGETVEVMLEYSNTLDINGHELGLRIPMTVTPRYSPELGGESPVGGAVLAAPDLPSYSNQAKLSVAIDGRLPLASIGSDSHDILNKLAGGVYTVHTQTPFVPMDRDFRLQWQLASTDVPQTAFFHQEVEGEHYGLMMMVPPIVTDSSYDPARELILIMDTSGSMGGESIRQAKKALLEALNHIDEQDRFNIIEFNSETKALFSTTVPATVANIAKAQRFVRRLNAEGGTEMLEAVETALNMPGDVELMRQVVFVTDGAISNEKQLFAAIHQLLGRSRLFTVGIGSAPNSHFMRKAAEFGRGSFVHINHVEQAAAQINQLVQKLQHPVLQDIAILLPQGVTSENWPEKVPDLFAGEPVLVAMKLDRFPSFIEVSGAGQQAFSSRVATSQAEQENNVAILWARQKIEALMNEQIRHNAMDSERDEIVEIALAHKLLTQYTSFVAVDKTPSRSAQAALKSGKVANLQASGSAYPNTALGSYRQLLIGLVLMALLFTLSRVIRARGQVNHVVA